VAALNPPHLAAICPWEGASDWYREFARHGGILCEFAADWYPRQVENVQHGVGDRGYTSAMTGELVAGPDTLDPDVLSSRRADLGADVKSRPVIDDWYLERNLDWASVSVPMLSAANWGGHGLHARGNFEAFVRAASEQKWLEVHGDAHWVDFYTDRGVALQKEFFGHFLKGEDNGWDRRLPVQLRVRHADGSLVDRMEAEWPLARTVWTEYHLTGEGGLELDVPAEAASSYDTTGDGITFRTAPFSSTTEITGPMAAKLWVSSETSDADLFLVVGLFDPDGGEVTFMGALDPNTPVAHGWLRASHRGLDPDLTLPYRPYHTHIRPEPLVPGEVYELDVEIWPTSIVVPKGYRVGLSIRGKDYVYPGPSGGKLSNFKNELTGCGPFLHDDPRDRPPAVFGGVTSLHFGGGKSPYLLLPIIPAAKPPASRRTRRK
jgi:hypothetical protein